MVKLKITIILNLFTMVLAGQLRYLPSTAENVGRFKDQYTKERTKNPEQYVVIVKNNETIVRSNNWLYKNEGLFNKAFPLFDADSAYFDEALLGSWGTEDESVLLVFTKPANSRYLILNTYKFFDYIKQYIPEQKDVQLGSFRIGEKFYIELNSPGTRQFVQQTNKYYPISYSLTDNDHIQFSQVSKRYYYKNPDVEITDESPVIKFDDVNTYRGYLEKSQVKADFYLSPFPLHRVKKDIVIATGE